MKNFSYLFLLFSTIFYCCGQTQVDTAILDCFEKNVFTKEDTFNNFEKELINKGIIKDNSAKSYHDLFAKYYLPYSSKNEEYYENKLAYVETAKTFFTSKKDFEKCLNTIPKSEINLPEFIKQINNVDKYIAAGELPDNLNNLTLHQIWMNEIDTQLFEHTINKYILVYILYRNNINYNQYDMEDDIESSKTTNGKHLILKN